MDLDKSVVFAYDGVPAHLQLYIWPFPPHTYTAYASPLDIVEKDLICLKATPNVSKDVINVSSYYWSPFHANDCIFSRNEQ